MTNQEAVDLSVVVGKLRLKNPVMPSSGTFGYGSEFARFLNIEDLGAVIVKGTTLLPRLGNEQHRFTEIAGRASLFTIGLQNVGIHRFIRDKLPYLREFHTPVLVNIAGERTEDYIKLTEILNEAEGVSGLEVNLTCPNVKKGGAQFSSNPDTTYEIVKAVRGATDLTIIPKLAPSLTEVAVLAKACEEAGADAVCPNYAITGMSIDVQTRRSKLGKNTLGGVGGPWKKPIGVKMVWQVAQVVKIPIVGVGGITGAEDALEFLIAGATAVEIGTYNLINPRVTVETVRGIRKYLMDKQIGNINEIIGSFQQ